MTPRRQPRRKRWSDIERTLRRSGGDLIAGVDEVGRGPLAGPVVACAVIMPPDQRAIAGVDDSKLLTAAERETLASKILDRSLAVSIGAASAREIDRLNIFHATVLAVRRAVSRLPLRADHVLIDGNQLRTLGVPHTNVVGGDHRCFSIACASIIAKVTRDRLMRSLARRYPNYGWERNAGYATRTHLTGLEAHGLTPHHRRSFTSARQLELALITEPAQGGESTGMASIDVYESLVPLTEANVGVTLPPDVALTDIADAAEQLASEQG